MVRLPWGDDILVDADETIGSALVRLGVYDLVLTEAIWRLTDPGETALDVGANIGVMTSAFAARVGRSGSVHAFEPHPDVCRLLRSNVGRWDAATVSVHEIGLSDQSRMASLFVPDDFGANAGTASLVNDEHSSNSISVRVSRLDDVLPESVVPVIAKLDVEGAELAVIHGAERVMSALRDVLFEDHHGYPSVVTEDLERRGFRVFRLERSALGPVLREPRSEPRASFDAQSFLATSDEPRAHARMGGRGWSCLRARR